MTKADSFAGELSRLRKRVLDAIYEVVSNRKFLEACEIPLMGLMGPDREIDFAITDSTGTVHTKLTGVGIDIQGAALRIACIILTVMKSRRNYEENDRYYKISN